MTTSVTAGRDAAGDQVPKRVRFWRRRSFRMELQGWLFISPWLIGFIVLTAGPYIASAVLAFMRWDMTREIKFVGLRNFGSILDDRLVGMSLLNTLYYSVFNVPGTVIISLVVASLLNIKVRGMAVYRTMFYLPSVTSGVGMAIIWMWLFAPAGIINSALDVFGISGPSWLISRTWAMPALIIMSFSTVGTTMVMFLAGLQGVPQQLHDAANVDGANGWQRARHVTLPMMTPYIFLATVMNVIGAFKVFTQALMMTGGGPDNATLFIFLYIYRNAWMFYKMGYASALAWLLAAIIFIFTLVQFSIGKWWVYYEYQG